MTFGSSFHVHAFGFQVRRYAGIGNLRSNMRFGEGSLPTLLLPTAGLALPSCPLRCTPRSSPAPHGPGCRVDACKCPIIANETCIPATERVIRATKYRIRSSVSHVRANRRGICAFKRDVCGAGRGAKQDLVVGLGHSSQRRLCAFVRTRRSSCSVCAVYFLLHESRNVAFSMLGLRCSMWATRISHSPCDGLFDSERHRLEFLSWE